MKNSMKIARWTLLTLLIMAVCGEWGLRKVTSGEWFRNYVISRLENTLHREVRAEKLSASLFGLRLSGVAISEEGGFKKGEFLTVRRARMGFSLLYLLRAHFKVNYLMLRDAKLTIVRYKDGKFNFTSMGESTSSEEPNSEAAEEDSSKSFRFTVRNISLDNFSFTYRDVETNKVFSAEDLSLMIQNFTFDQEFLFTLNTKLGYKGGDKQLKVPIGLKAKAHLGNLDFSKAYIEIVDLSVKHQRVLFRLNARMDNWQEIQFWAKLTSKKFSSRIVEPWMKCPEFEMQDVSLYAAGKMIPAASMLTISSGTIHLPGSDVFVSGKYNYDKNTYEAEGNYRFDVGEFSPWLPSEYKKIGLGGIIQGKAVADTKQAQLEFTIENGAYFHPTTGHFSNLSGNFSILERMSFEEGRGTGSLTGNLNQNPFEINVLVQQQPKQINVDLNASSKRVALPPAPPNKQDEPEFVEDVSLKPMDDSTWKLPSLFLKANIKVDSLDAPYLYGTNVQFSADLQKVTSRLNETQGTLSLKMGEGKIMDLYKLTNENAITKVLFLSLNITGKVFNSLNVFSVLNGLGKGVISVVTNKQKEESSERMIVQPMMGPDGEPMEIMVPYTEQKIKGQMSYEKFETDVNFSGGLATIKEGTFVSDMMSFRLDGTTDFNTGKIDMKVRAAPGKHEVDGIMPLTIHIGGTVADPKGNMSMLGSVTSLVTQGVANNAVSRQIKKGVKGFFGLFRKEAKLEGEEEITEMPSEEQSASSGLSPSQREDDPSTEEKKQ